MNKIIFKFENKRFGDIYCTNYALWVLSYFFSQYPNKDGLIYWIQDPLDIYPGLDPNLKFGGGYGEIGLKKIKNNLRLHASWEARYKKDLNKYSLLIPIDQFVYIVDNWFQLKALDKPYIIITEENNKYNIKALDELTPEDQLLVDSNND